MNACKPRQKSLKMLLHCKVNECIVRWWWKLTEGMAEGLYEMGE